MSLPPQFTGEPARVGLRLAAFTVDAFIVVSLIGAVWIATSSAVWGILLGAEAVLALWVLQARTGLGPGKALLGLRVARHDAPFSPGAGRAFVRGSLVALGGLVLLAGAWGVQASAAADRSGLRRSWADRAAQTVVVAAPARSSRGRRRRSPTGGYAVPSPTVVVGRRTPGPDRPSPDARRPPEPPHAPDALPPAPAWGSPMPAPRTEVDPDVARTGSETGRPGGRATGAVPRLPVSEPSITTAGELLLVFDTGQRARLGVPLAVNLGRSPERTEPGDAVLVVADPDASVSKTHLRLEHDGRGTWATDGGSTNGTELIDGDGTVRTLTPGVRVPVDDDTRVRIGNRVFTVSRLIGEQE